MMVNLMRIINNAGAIALILISLILILMLIGVLIATIKNTIKIIKEKK